ncbi:anti-sigma regulatory factor (Ser/Thr protein kinase) [Streptosporangium becharense]|uniref:Anti-sigma regulatory factor (Ser/Thr protein kinase) n=1 Tax=Streptosporangium becharense TaxID=1816182 RepID=A0A7W9MF94_9ACTN|nr:ATP-binding protein [Streptosporangium becharense]MBB2912013.1 anti-sigma regulatory factor (Ser/Thr protein kinase) [Streptosporangium becharense]MBB5818560.1 anti-sigma regulatory factor (Ser/Thr protein kinase) [Streptosporangium becharense]
MIATVQSAQTAPRRASTSWTALDWWPPLGWWPDSARDLLPGSPEATASATFVLPPHVESVHSARSFTTGTLTGWGLTELGENMELVVSELATNAFRHGLRLAERARAKEPIRLSLIRRDSLVTCTLNDPGAGFPALRESSPLDVGGLGLHIVESLSLRWGWAPLAPYGKIVWAVLQSVPCEAPDRPGRP